MIVVDAMILAYAIIEVPGQTPAVNRLLDQDLVWGAPTLWRSELRNVLLQYVRAVAGDQSGTTLTLDDARRKMQVAETLMGDRTFEVDSASVLEEAASTGFSAYDSEYVVLAKELKVSLVTTDGEVLRGVPDVAVRPENVGGDQGGSPVHFNSLMRNEDRTRHAGRALHHISAVGASRGGHEIEALRDAGFNGALALPPSQVSTLGLREQSRTTESRRT